MAGARMGIWCAHGEGRAIFPDPAVLDAVLADGLAPIRCRPGAALGAR
jgi:phosphoribosylformylglycinamidine synthase